MDNDLISRSALLETQTYMFDEALGTSPCVLTEDIKAAPAEDAVEVVRCEKCVFKQPPEEYGDLMCGMLKVPMKSNDFCSYGERMADNA